MTARDALGFDLSGNVAKLLEAVVEGQLGLVALGLFGLAVGLNGGPGRRSGERTLWRIVAVWLAVGLAAVLGHTPIWSHHHLLLVFPLAVAAGCGLWAVVDVLGYRAVDASDGHGDDGAGGGRDPAGRGGDIAGWRAFAVTAAGAALLSLPVQAVRLVDTTRTRDDAAEAAIARLAEVARPGDYVITDSPMIAFRAGLLVPPDLCDPGKKRIDAGELTVEAVLADIARFQPRAVLFWEGRLSRGPFGGFPEAIEAAGFRRIAELDVRAERWLYAR